MRAAKKNYMIPNPEWFHKEWLRYANVSTIPQKGKLDMILCKTHDAVNLFKKHTPHVARISFTSKDMYLPGIEKKKSFIHCAGKSSAKGTDQVVEAWKNNPEFPELLLLQSFNHKRQVPANVNYQYRRVEENEYLKMLNERVFHLCPSTYEGWGHYIWEAMSTGGIVITTDGAPMNEFVNNNHGFLVKVSNATIQNIAELKHVTSDGVTDAVKKCLKLSDNQLCAMSSNARTAYQENENYFKETLLNILN